MEKSFDSLGVLRKALERRFKTPKRSTTFHTHLIVIVFLGGGIGIWFPPLQESVDVLKLATAFLTYFPAIVAVALLEFVEEEKLYLRNFGVTASFMLGVLFLIGATRTDPNWKFYWAIIGTFLSVLLWWLANGEKERFMDTNADDAVGGSDVNIPLPPTTPAGWTA